MSHLQQISSIATSRISECPEHKYAKYFVIPQRHILSFVATLIILNAIAARTLLEVIVLENFVYLRNNRTSNNTCAARVEYPELPPPPPTALMNFSWSMHTRYTLRDAFYWGSVLTRLPGGYLSDQFGGIYIVTLSILLDSFCQIILPAIVDISKAKKKSIIAVRFVQGVFHGPLSPSLMAVLARWVPISERTTMICSVFAVEILGEQFGFVIHQAFVSWTWRPGFYLFGIIGLILCIFWYLLAYPTPDENPFLKRDERKLLEEEIDPALVNGWKRVPWREIAASRAVWALGLLHLAEYWGWTTFVAAMHIYLPQVLKGQGFRHTVWWIPFFLYFGLAMFFGYISDWFINGKHLSVTATRKITATIACLSPALCLIFLTFDPCKLVTKMVWFTVGLCLSSAYYSAHITLAMDLTTNFVGCLYGITSTIDKIMHSIGTHLVAHLTLENSLSEWAFLFYITGFTEFFMTLIFLFLGNANTEPWNNVRK